MAAVAVDTQPRPAHRRPHLRVVGPGGPAGRPLPARVYLRRRLAVVAAVATVVVAVFGLMSGGAPPALQDAPTPGPVITVLVGQGDSLWDAVAPYAPAGAHPSAYVLEVAAFNDIDPRTVAPGTVLRLPQVVP